MMDIEDSMLQNLKSADYKGFIKLGMEFSDAVIKAEDNSTINGMFEEMTENNRFEVIEKDDNFTDSYYNLYNELAG